MIRFYIIASGQVQGVGFRYFVKYTAERYGMTGWVRNLENGTVDMEIQGAKLEMDTFLRAVSKGSRYSFVEDLQITEIEPIEERSFQIKME